MRPLPCYIILENVANVEIARPREVWYSSPTVKNVFVTFDVLLQWLALVACECGTAEVCCDGTAYFTTSSCLRPSFKGTVY